MSARRPPPTIDGLHSLKVDNISYNTTQADLRRVFDKYGEIGDVHIPRDKYTRQSKGFAFVRYFSRSDAEYAQERTDGRWVDGRELRVSVARYERPTNERGDARRRSRSPRRRASPRYSRSRSRSPRRRSRSRSPRDRKSRSPRNRSRSPSRSKSRSPRNRSKSPSRSPDAKASREISASPKRSTSRSRSPFRGHSQSP